jgi:hypothetical protein
MRDPAPATLDIASRRFDLALLVLLVLLPLIACRRIIVFALLNRPQSCEAFNELMLSASSAAYNRGILAVNYFEHGFARRGLGGTLLTILNETPVTGCIDQLIIFHLLSAVWLALPLVLLVRRVARLDGNYGAWLALVLLLAPHLFWAWGGDLGRVDMLTSGCIAWSVIALLSARHAMAILSILAGTLAHESTAIYGIPLLFVLWPRRDRAGCFRRTAILVAAVALLTVAQFALTTASDDDIVAAVLRTGPPSFLRDVAAYMTSTGARSVVTSWCQSLGRPATPFYLFCVFLLIAVYALLLFVRAKQATRYAFATVLPTVAMSIVAIDYGRWLVMATVNAWLFAAAMAIQEQPPQLAARSFAARLAGLLVLLAMRPPPVYVPNLFVQFVAGRIWGAESAKLREMDECDPAWRTSIGLPAKADYPPPPKFRKSIFHKN